MDKNNIPLNSPSQPGFNPPPDQHVFPPPTEQLPQANTVIIQQQTAPPMMGREPARITCPNCHAQITTTVENDLSTKTHLFALLLCLFGCWPCCCIPYCMDSCQIQTHYCPHCKAYLGKYEN